MVSSFVLSTGYSAFDFVKKLESRNHFILMNLAASEEIKDTRTLVDAYNNSGDSMKRKLLRHWLQCYINYCHPEVMNPSEVNYLIEEIEALCAIQDEIMAQSLLKKLSEPVLLESFFTKDSIKTLEHVLNASKRNVLRQTYDVLQRLLKTLQKFEE